MRQVDRILYPWLWERKHQWIIVLDSLSTEGAEFLWELLQPVASSGMLQSRACKCTSFIRIQSLASERYPFFV
jgi:hypothetical protein